MGPSWASFHVGWALPELSLLRCRCCFIFSSQVFYLFPCPVVFSRGKTMELSFPGDPYCKQAQAFAFKFTIILRAAVLYVSEKLFQLQFSVNGTRMRQQCRIYSVRTTGLLQSVALTLCMTRAFFCKWYRATLLLSSHKPISISLFRRNPTVLESKYHLTHTT